MLFSVVFLMSGIVLPTLARTGPDARIIVFEGFRALDHEATLFLTHLRRSPHL